jgi:hypothetical protein
MLEPFVGPFGQRFHHDPLELDRHAGPKRRGWLGILVVDRIHHRLIVVALERPPPRDHLIQNGTERPDIRPVIHLLAPRLFG